MWGHHVACGCNVCNCLPRLFLLISQGSGLPLFLEGVGTRLRVLEAEVLDELFRRGFVEGRLRTPNLAPGPPPTKAAAVPPVEPTPPANAPPPAAAPPRQSQEGASQNEPAAEPIREEKAEASQAAASLQVERSKEEVDLAIYPKSSPSAPSHLATPVTPVKAEEEPPEAEPGTGVEEVAKAAGEEPKSKEKRSRPKASHSRHRRRRSEPRRSHSGRARSSGRRRDRSRGRQRRERTRTPRSEGGKEKKARPDRPPEPVGLPPHWRDNRAPHEPDYPPPRDQRRPQGPGWVGPVPYSDHARWSTGKSRGVVRRPNEELYNRRRRENRGGR